MNGDSPASAIPRPSGKGTPHRKILIDLKEIITSKLYISLIGIGITTASASAFAGPDWQIIERARQARHAEAHVLSKQTAGPRDTVRFAAQDPATMQAMKVCAETMQKRN